MTKSVDRGLLSAENKCASELGQERTEESESQNSSVCYETPRLHCLGNLRELIRDLSGTGGDAITFGQTS